MAVIGLCIAVKGGLYMERGRWLSVAIRDIRDLFGVAGSSNTWPFDILSGRGKSDFSFFLRPGNLKREIVVESLRVRREPCSAELILFEELIRETEGAPSGEVLPL